MSDQIEDFDRVFREKLGEQTATPPESVWENIKAKRTYGHVVSNRVMNYWKTFGTMMLILLAGGLGLSSGSEQNMASEAVSLQAENEPTIHSEQNFMLTEEALADKVSKKTALTDQKTNSKNTLNTEAFPSADLLALVHKAGFSKPNLIANKRLDS